MKNIKLILAVAFLYAFALNAQNDKMYIMKNGVIAAQYNVAEVDSLTFTEPITTVSVTSVSVSPTTATLNIGETQQLTATVVPANATNLSVTWSSSNNAVATVNSSGLVTAISEGPATITVTTVDGNRTATSSITVNPVVEPSSCLNTNGDFANATPNTGYTGYYHALDGGTATANFDVVSGELAVTSINATADWQVSLVYQYNFVQGKNYKISFSARAASNKNIPLRIRECVAGDCDTFDNSTSFNLTATMQNFEFVFSQTEPTYEYGQLMLWLGVNAANVYFDNVCIEETTAPPPPPPVTCIASSDFQSGMGAWSVYNGGTTATSAIVSGELQIANIPTIGTWDMWKGAVMYGLNAVNGQTYNLKFDARSPGTGGKVVRVLVKNCVSGDCGANFFLEREFQLTSTMQSFSLEYKHIKPSSSVQVLIQFLENTNNLIIDNICLATGALPAPTPNGKTLNIIAIGDSISQGGHGPSGTDLVTYGGTYRKELYYRLKAMGYDVNMLGDRYTLAHAPTLNTDPNPVFPHMNGLIANVSSGFDQDHVCYWGNTTTQLRNYVNNNKNSYGKPDIALIHLGTNNLSPTSTAISDLNSIINNLRTLNPNVKILLAKLIPSTTSSTNTNITNYNNVVMPAVLSGAPNTAQSPIIIVDQNAAINISNPTEWHDGLHPSYIGASKMADKWIEAILANP